MAGDNFENNELPKAQKNAIGTIYFGTAENSPQTPYDTLPGDAKKMLQLPRGALSDELILHHLDRAQNSWKIIATDMDHTVYDRGIILNPEKQLDISAYSPVERQNIDLLLIHALMGNPICVETGKDANIWPMATYMNTRLKDLGKLFGLTEKNRTDNYFKDGRLRSLDRTKPVFFAFSTGNGGLTFELTAPVGTEALIVYKPIPLDSWETMQKDEELLRASTDHRRIRQLTGKEADGSPISDAHRGDARRIDLGNGDGIETFRMAPRVPYNPNADPYNEQRWHIRTDQRHYIDTSHISAKERLRREVAPDLSAEELDHRIKLQASMRDFLAFTSWSTKANLVFDLERIVKDSVLNEAWFQRTGVRIDGETQQEQRASLIEACSVLARSWGEVTIAQAYAGGTFYLDVTAPRVNKQMNARWVKKYVQAVYAMEQLEEKNLPITVETINGHINATQNKLWSIKVGDGGRLSNDDPMLRSGGGAIVTDPEENYGENEPKPLRLSRVFGKQTNLVLTNKFLLFQLLAQNYSDDTTRNILVEKLLFLGNADWKR